MTRDDIALDDIAQKLTQKRGAMHGTGGERCGEASTPQVLLQALRARLLRGEFEELVVRKRKHLMRKVPASELGAEFSTKQTRIRSSEADAAAFVQQGAHQPLPFGDFLHLIEINGGLGMTLVKDGDERREILWPEAIEPGVLQIDRGGLSLHRPSDLALQRAFSTTPHASEHQRVGLLLPAIPCRLSMTAHLALRRKRGRRLI